MFVYGLFGDEESAARAIEGLIEGDFAAENISALLHEGAEVEELPVKKKTATARGAVIGAALGAIGGALLAPGAGLLAGGPLLVAIQGALAAGAAGAGLGAVGGLGHWHEELDFVHHHLDQGGVIVGVETISERQEAAKDALRAAGASDVQARSKEAAVEDAKRL